MADEAIIIIGAGSAGTQAARALARAGRRVVITDPAPYGGTCIWRGCVAKKSLYAAGGVHHELLNTRWLVADVFRPPSGDHPVDWTRLLAWQQDVMHAYAGDQEGILRDLGVEMLHEQARFLSPDTVEIAGQSYRASHVVIATGSRPVLPPIPGSELMDTSDEALFYPHLPASLVVIGGGYIAMEMAGIYAAFGSNVQLVARSSQVLEPFDPECGLVAIEGLQALGVRVHLETDPLRVAGRPGSLTVDVHGAGSGERQLTAERVLAATGRQAAVLDLDLAAGEVEVDERGRPAVLKSLRSASNPRVWLAGDAAGGLQLTPVASYEAGHVARNIVNGTDDPVDLATVASTCFTHPQVAKVGMSEAEAAAQGGPYQVARGGFAATAQAIIENERLGLVKLVADDEGRLLGAHLAGPQAAELIFGLALGLRAGATLDEIQATIAVHPSFAEALNWTSFAAERVEAKDEQADEAPA